MSREGKGVRIRGGVPRTYYVGIESAVPAVPGMLAPLKALAVVPFGMEEGTSTACPSANSRLVVKRARRVSLFNSAVHKNDRTRHADRRCRRRPRGTVRHRGEPARERRCRRVRARYTRKPRDGDRVASTVVRHPRTARRWKLEFNVRETSSLRLSQKACHGLTGKSVSRRLKSQILATICRSSPHTAVVNAP